MNKEKFTQIFCCLNERNNFSNLLQYLEGRGFYRWSIAAYRNYEGGLAEHACFTFEKSREISDGFVDEKSLAVVALLYAVHDWYDIVKKSAFEITDSERNVLKAFNNSKKNNECDFQIAAQKTPLFIVTRLAVSMDNPKNKDLEGNARPYDSYVYLDGKHINTLDSFNDFKKKTKQIVPSYHLNSETLYVSLAFAKELQWEKNFFLTYQISKIASSYTSPISLLFDKVEVMNYSYNTYRIYLVASKPSEEFNKLQNDINEAYKKVGEYTFMGIPRICVANFYRDDHSEEDIKAITKQLQDLKVNIELNSQDIVLDKRSHDKMRLVGKWGLGSENTFKKLGYDEQIEGLMLDNYRYKNNVIDGFDDWVFWQIANVLRDKNTIAITNLERYISANSKNTIFEKYGDSDILKQVLHKLLTKEQEDSYFQCYNFEVEKNIMNFENFPFERFQKTYDNHPLKKRIVAIAKEYDRGEMAFFVRELKELFQIDVSEGAVVEILQEEEGFKFSDAQNSFSYNKETETNINNYNIDENTVFNYIRDAFNFNEDKLLESFDDLDKEIKNLLTYIDHLDDKYCVLKRCLPTNVVRWNQVDDYDKDEYIGSLLVRIEMLLKSLYPTHNRNDRSIKSYHHEIGDIGKAFDKHQQPKTPIQTLILNVNNRRNDYAHGTALSTQYAKKNWRDCLALYIFLVRGAKK